MAGFYGVQRIISRGIPRIDEGPLIFAGDGGREDLKERLAWIIRLRWVAIVGVLVATHVMRETAFLRFSMIPVYTILGFSALYNLYFERGLKLPKENLQRIALLQIFLDQVVLACAVYFSGGCDSPFIYFFIFHMVIGGIILPWKYTAAFSGLAVFFPALVMAFKHWGVLPHYGIFSDKPLIFTSMTLMAAYGSVFASTIFLTAYFAAYLSRKLYQKNAEIRKLYVLSERLRSSLRLCEIVDIIGKELRGFSGAKGSCYMTLRKDLRVLSVQAGNGEVSVPLIDRNSFTDALFQGTAMTIERRAVGSGYESDVLNALGADRMLLLPVMAASPGPCYLYFQCTHADCGAYGKDTKRCWQVAGTHCRGVIHRNIAEKLEHCLSCEIFTPVGLYLLNIGAETGRLDRADTDACMRLLDTASLAVSNALLYERTVELSKTDGLTGLTNRREFNEILHAEFLRAARYHRPFSLLMIDVDDFKHYNDANGHPQGDILLKKIAEVIRDNFKETDVVARYGGEEFCVILFETRANEQGRLIAERLRDMISWCRFPREETQPGRRAETAQPTF